MEKKSVNMKAAFAILTSSHITFLCLRPGLLLAMPLFLPTYIMQSHSHTILFPHKQTPYTHSSVMNPLLS